MFEEWIFFYCELVDCFIEGGGYEVGYVLVVWFVGLVLEMNMVRRFSMVLEGRWRMDGGVMVNNLVYLEEYDFWFLVV